jgi:hypothetical protein
MPSPATKVFFIEETNRYRRSFRRYRGSITGDKCPGGPYGYHNASTFIETLERDEAPTSGRECDTENDPRWPARCEHCSYEFQPDDEWQVNYDNFYRAADGREFLLREAPPGACWDAWWMYRDSKNAPRGRDRTGPDGRFLIVKCPNGHDWMVDWRASNCTMREDNEHRCWVRHGRPEDGTLHVDKNGLTCAAGAGSIVAGDYHGFLHNGWFTPG